MNLLDRGVKMAAEADEPIESNFVRKHALEQVWTYACMYERLVGWCWLCVCSGRSVGRRPTTTTN